MQSADETPPPITAAPERRRIRQLETIVAEVIRETPDTVTLVLFTGNDRLEYQAGHFLTIDPHQFEDLERFVAFFEDLKGRKEPARAYSMSSAPHERHLAFTVKEELYISGTTKYPPLLSPFLVRQTLRGTPLTITGFTGAYVLTPRILSKTRHLFHVCAGSGIVPNFAIIKSALAEHPDLHHTLLYSSRTWNDIIFRNQLEQLSRSYPGKLKIIHTLTREKDLPAESPNFRTGRVGMDLLKELLPLPPDCHFFICGPAVSAYDRQLAKERSVEPEPRFMETVLAGLAMLGARRDQITHESYG